MPVSLVPIGSDAKALQQRLAELEAEQDSLREQLTRAVVEASEGSAQHGIKLTTTQASLIELATPTAENVALHDVDAALKTSQAVPQRTEARLQVVMESATEYAIVTLALDGTITGWNSGAELLLGWTEVEALGRNIELFFTPEDRAAGVPAEEMRTAHMQGRASDERWHLRRNGEQFWASGTMMPMRDLGGPVMGYLKILRDRTPQHEAGQALQHSEARLRDSEARFRAMADNIPALAWMANPDGYIVWYNRRWHEYCGTTLAEMEGWGWQSVHDPLVLPDVLERWRACITDGTPFEMTFPLRGADGVFRPFLTRVQPVRDEAGQVVQWFGTNIDVTESRAAETANARFAAIVASSNDAIVSFAVEDGRVLTWNKGAEQLFGYTEIEMVGSPAGRLLPPDLPEDERAGLLTWALSGRPVVAHETVRVSKNGERIPVSITATRMLTPNGQVMGVAGIFHDLRPRLRAEERLRESEDQLRQAQKLEAIGRLAAGVAHDFNNILQGVLGGLELVREEVEVGSPAHEFADIALNSARRGSYLTHHLLAYARKQMLQPKPVELAPFLSDMQRLLTRTLGPHISINVQVEQALPLVRVDPGQLQTALLNLAINGSHAMPRGGTLSLDAHEDSHGGERVVIAVVDTGVGMDETTLAQAFEPFFTTKGLDGTGLGLSMVQGFAEQSGGEVRIASAPGQGTTVELRLPAAPPIEKPDEQHPATLPLRGSGRILLVDDVSDVLVTAKAFLERAGFQVVQAGSGDEALAILSSGERFNAVVSDYAMPGLNGVDLIEQIRALQPALPALIITGFAEVGGADTLPEAVAVLRKPFQRRELVKAVLQAIGQDADGTGVGNKGEHG
ncbi:MAG: PAS domain S-box protein [Chloroflexota bacterium]|nr:PAS domain S-box protein [Chloroflexota bacterium]